MQCECGRALEPDYKYCPECMRPVSAVPPPRLTAAELAAARAPIGNVRPHGDPAEASDPFGIRYAVDSVGAAWRQHLQAQVEVAGIGARTERLLVLAAFGFTALVVVALVGAAIFHVATSLIVYGTTELGASALGFAFGRATAGRRPG